MIIRDEQPDDPASIREINEQAFGQPDEANLVDALRETCSPLLSFVATTNDRVVGHILFSPVAINNNNQKRESDYNGPMGLAPMAVRPEFQRQGIGSALVKEGIIRLEAGGCPLVVVLGHPKYYPRFGFVPASTVGLRCIWDVPDEVFMALVLDKGWKSSGSGLVQYHPEFDDL